MFSDNYIALCASRKKDVTTVAEEIGFSRTTGSKWASGSIPRKSTLKQIASYFGVTVEELLRDDDNKQEPAYRVPVLGRVPAGVPIEAIETIIDWEEIPASMARGGKEYFCLEVEGDSMYPDYLPGDRIIVRQQADCDSGDDCVVYINSSDATLKQIKKNADGSIMIIPRNTAYPPQKFSPEEIKNLPISIAGVVVEMRRKKKY